MGSSDELIHSIIFYEWISHCGHINHTWPDKEVNQMLSYGHNLHPETPLLEFYTAIAQPTIEAENTAQGGGDTDEW